VYFDAKLTILVANHHLMDIQTDPGGGILPFAVETRRPGGIIGFDTSCPLSAVGLVWPTVGGMAPDPGGVFRLLRRGIVAMAPAEVPTGNDTGRQLGRVSVGRDGLRAVVWLSGEHDLATKGAVATALADAVAADVDVVVDLTDARFMDACILGVLVHSRGLLADGGWSLTFRGAQGVARRVIEVCGLAGLIEGPVGMGPRQRSAPSALETWVEVPPADSPGQSRRPSGRVGADSDAQCRTVSAAEGP
jgi:anti-anti-sigma factor